MSAIRCGIAAMGPNWQNSAFPAAFEGKVSNVAVEHYETLDPNARPEGETLHVSDPLTASLPAVDPTASRKRGPSKPSLEAIEKRRVPSPA